MPTVTVTIGVRLALLEIMLSSFPRQICHLYAFNAIIIIIIINDSISTHTKIKSGCGNTLQCKYNHRSQESTRSYDGCDGNELNMYNGLHSSWDFFDDWVGPFCINHFYSLLCCFLSEC